MEEGHKVFLATWHHWSDWDNDDGWAPQDVRLVFIIWYSLHMRLTFPKTNRMLGGAGSPQGHQSLFLLEWYRQCRLSWFWWGLEVYETWAKDNPCLLRNATKKRIFHGNEDDVVGRWCGKWWYQISIGDIYLWHWSLTFHQAVGRDSQHTWNFSNVIVLTPRIFKDFSTRPPPKKTKRNGQCPNRWCDINLRP